MRVPLTQLAAERIALIKPSALGDIVHSLPVLTALRQRFPAAHITWVVNRVYEPLLKGHPDLDATLPFERNVKRQGILTGTLALTGFFRRLRAERFDLVIDLQGLLRTGLMSYVTGAKRRIGMGSAREGARWFYTDTVSDRRNEEHAVDRYWHVADALGVGDLPKTFRIAVPQSARLWARTLLENYPRPLFAVGVGARWLTKRWPPEHFAALVNLAQERFGGTAILVGSPDEAPLSQLALSAINGPALDVTGQTTLPQLAAILSEVDVMLGNDTGPLHLAVALGRAVVAPYTCTEIRQTGPYGQSARAVATTVWCRASYVRKCDRLECMAELTPARLWPPLAEVLASWQSQRQSA